jgi:mono/diheme cytochrome c family protein
MRVLIGILGLLMLAFGVLAANAEPLADWDKVYKVFSHPRCSNCHTADDHPRWVDAKTGAVKFHGMNVKRGSDESGFGNPGLRCTTCHGKQNGVRKGTPPGAPNWHLAPVEMVWFEQTSAQICAQIKDPARNGGRTLADVADHVLHDPLVLWGWEPGTGREPAPGSAQETFDALKRWSDAGAPCP